MLQRVLGVTFAQAIRSAAIFIFPLAFITLIAWATAGSASGTTSDPIRAAMWIWLGAHQVHFDLALSPSGVDGYLSYLPIGGLLLPILALRAGFKRVISKLDGDFSNLTGVRLFFSLFYAILTAFIALFSSSAGVKPQWWMAAIFAFFIAIGSSFIADRSISLAMPVILALRTVALLVGFGFLIFAIAFFNNFGQATLITQVLAPGIFGSLLLLFLNLLYLPNVALAGLSYISGAGFAVGAGTHLSPFTQDIGQIPALPLLAALPINSNKWLLILSIVIIAIGALLGYWTVSLQERTSWQSFFIVIVMLALLAYFASGSLITQAMGAVGVSIWKFILFVGAQLLIGLLAFKFIPRMRIFFSMKKIAILASGSGTLAEAIFEAVDKNVLACTVEVLICDKPDALVIERARKFRIPVHLHPMKQDRELWNLELLHYLQSLDLDLVVSAGFMRILDHTVTSSLPIINSHPSLLPLFPGAHAVHDALAAGVGKTGTTIHWVDAGVDTGEIIAQAELDIAPDDNEETLHERIKILERSLIVATIEQVLLTMENGRS